MKNETKEKIRIAGLGIGFISGIGASIVVGHMAAPVIVGAGIVKTAVCTMGISGLSGIASDKVCEYFQRQAEALISIIESGETHFHENKEKVNEETEA